MNPPIEVGPAFLPMDESRDRLFHRGVHLGRFAVRTPRRLDERLVQVLQAPHWRRSYPTRQSRSNIRVSRALTIARIRRSAAGRAEGRGGNVWRPAPSRS